MTATQDLTQGSLSRHLVHLAVPLVFGNILQEFYNTIDAFVVGRFAGQEEFAAIGVAGTVMNLFLFALVGCCTGFSVLFAHAYGQDDIPELHRQEVSALTVGLGCTALLMLLGMAGMHPCWPFCRHRLLCRAMLRSICGGSFSACPPRSSITCLPHCCVPPGTRRLRCWCWRQQSVPT